LLLELTGFKTLTSLHLVVNPAYLNLAILIFRFHDANKLNSMARQSSAERAWSAIDRFYDNCKKKAKGKKGLSPV
jgi:transposase